MTVWLDDIVREEMLSGGPFTGGPPKGVLHTTETSGWPGYRGGKVAPHFTIAPVSSTRRLSYREHVSLDLASRSLVNRIGGVETNRDHVIQIELIGTCDPTRTDLFSWPNAPDWALEQLATFMRRLEFVTGIRPIVVPQWKAYPDSYGQHNGVRLSLSRWDNYNGWCGHQHVPENDHGDPGSLPARRLVSNVTSPAVVPVFHSTSSPGFPLPRTSFYGPRGRSVHNGYRGSTDRQNIRTWQARMRYRGWGLQVDGLYGPQSERVARQFQQEKRLGIDGLVGPVTWGASWTAPIT